MTATSVVTSGLTHASETADALSSLCATGTKPVVLPALTPGGGPGGIADVIEQALVARENGEQVGLEPDDCLLVVGHEGRLSDLFTELTGTRFGPLIHGGAVTVTAGTIQDLAAGRGHPDHRFPTVDHQEDALRAKVNSKMTVATLLAGFVFTALSALLLLEHREGWPWHRVLAMAALTVSFTMFVASVYIYDQLGTPSGFWTDADRPRRLWRLLYEHREDRVDRLWSRARQEAPGNDENVKRRLADETPGIHRPTKDGPVYWLMVHTSRYLFTPAVALALAGFVFLLVGADDLWILTLGVAGLLAAAGYAAFHRPDLGAD